jgi:hypothetical protein
MKINNKNKEVIVFDLCSKMSLLEQMDSKLPKITMMRAAKEAYDLLADFSQRAASAQVDLMSKMNVQALYGVTVVRQATVSAAVAAAAVMMATRGGRLTANEKILLAMETLGNRYQADW